MSRPPLHSMLRTLVAAVACVMGLAIVQKLQDNDSSAATPGLTATFSGKAFAAGAGDASPAMRVQGLRQGQATSGTVTVRNPGPGMRYFWLSPGRVRERLGAGGGRLTSAIAVTVMELSDISSPTVVYRGPLRYVGARPLGFLKPGARRSFSFVAELPAGGRSPAAPSVDPYRGARATIGWAWHSLPGRPDAPAPIVPTKRDDSPPTLAFSVPRRQQVLAHRALGLTVRCSEDCAAVPRATATIRGRTARLKVRDAVRGVAVRHQLTIRFTRRQMAALRAPMLGGRPTKVRLGVEAQDRSGNRRRDSHMITLRPRR